MPRTVSRPRKWVSKPDMNAFGLFMATGIAVVLLPLLPFALLLWVLTRVLGLGRTRQEEGGGGAPT